MKMSDYRAAKLAIYESANSGSISTIEKCKLFAALEAKKGEDNMTKAEAIDCLKKVAGSFEDLEDDVDKILEKLDKMEDANEDDDDDEGEGNDDGDNVEESYSEAYSQLASFVESLENYE